MGRSCCSGTSTGTGTRNKREPETKFHNDFRLSARAESQIAVDSRLNGTPRRRSPAGASCVRIPGLPGYVPSLQVARYFTWDGVSVSMFVPMLFNFNRATSRSISGGTM